MSTWCRRAKRQHDALFSRAAGLLLAYAKRQRGRRARARQSRQGVNQPAACWARIDRPFAIGRLRRLLLGSMPWSPPTARHLSDDAAAHAHLLSNGALRKLSKIKQPANFQDQSRGEHRSFLCE
jgi:hypothetical protein